MKNSHQNENLASKLKNSIKIKNWHQNENLASK